MRDARREYQLAFVQTLLHQSKEPLTAAEVAEQLVVMAALEGHPEKCWRKCDAGAVFGHLRALERAGKVRKNGSKADSRAGRESPAFEPVGARHPAMPPPFPPEEDLESVPAPPPVVATPYDGLSRLQLYTLLAAHDDLAILAHDHMRRIQDWTERTVRKLADVGLVLPEMPE